jgi:hypothetical protein
MSPSGNGTGARSSSTRPDRRVEMRLETTAKELVRWIPDPKVLAPRACGDRIAEKLQDGLHQDEASGPNDKGCIAA